MKNTNKYKLILVLLALAFVSPQQVMAADIPDSQREKFSESGILAIKRCLRDENSPVEKIFISKNKKNPLAITVQNGPVMSVMLVGKFRTITMTNIREDTALILDGSSIVSVNKLELDRCTKKVKKEIEEDEKTDKTASMTDDTDEGISTEGDFVDFLIETYW